MAHGPSHPITAPSVSSPGRPQDPYQGLWPGEQAALTTSLLPEVQGLLAPLQAIRLGDFLTGRWLGRGLG
ncbi:hypothetical protein [Rhizobium glycinendophyticum]|uniref:Uncharacterized protein n=1 Tax=Rhizobium glycinendophyticum TaxID=2589807 RepID=A0A504USL4_9HYPH|nr:hypothetical protein [Rhizobium glycinendophyticum]TPP09711.1 hypothetical protein FJQ55_02190 [Rhizobium glycinendophyticum]